ncbi:hypothetical protein ACFQDD_12755, partial [Halorubrum pallidum]
EIDLGLGETLDRADAEIDNTGTLAAFRTRVREVLGIEDEETDDDGSARTSTDPATADTGGDGT